jgi:hypothetical protein
VRERQDLVMGRQREIRHLDAAAGRADREGGEEARSAIAALDKRLDAIDIKLATEFPNYAELSNPRPLSVAVVRALLRPDEALVLFLDVPQFPRLSEETLAWVITKDAVQWRSISLGTRA